MEVTRSNVVYPNPNPMLQQEDNQLLLNVFRISAIMKVRPLGCQYKHPPQLSLWNAQIVVTSIFHEQ